MGFKVGDLFVKLGLKNQQYNQGLKQSEQKTNAFGQGLKKIGGLIAGAFAVGAIVSFGKELLMLGGVAEGVRAAFERIAPAGTMKDLQEATAGTVSELELMKRAVSAKNLGLPVEKLASLFEFATKRAQETGESVDFLVNSIVTGIGRKSPLILDNLGISAIQLREKLKGVGFESAKVADIAAAVGEIAADSMRESGEIIDTNAVKVANLKRQWDDLKLAISENDTVTKIFADTLSKMQQFLFVIGSETATTLEKWAISVELFDKRAEKIFNDVKKREDALLDLRSKSSIELRKLYEQEEKKYLNLIELRGGSAVGLGKEANALAKLGRQIDEIITARRKSINHIDEETVEYRNQINAEAKAREEKIRLGRTINEIKKETEELTKTLGEFGQNQTIEIQNTLKQIEANKELIKTLTTLKKGIPKRGETPSIISTRGDTPQIGLDFVPEDGLANMDAFMARMKQQLADFSADYLSDWNELGAALDRLIVDNIVDVIGEFGQAVGDMFADDFNIDEVGGRMLKLIGNFLGNFGKMLIAYGLAQEAFWTSLGLGPAGAPLAIAAGAALVLIGGAISGMGARVSKGNLSSSGANKFNVTSVNREDRELKATVKGRDLAFVLTKQNNYTNRT